MKRTASAAWWGTLRDGKGELSTESGVLESTPYSFHTRFEDGKGTNPEELIGAAHAGCFSMALANIMKEAGMEPARINTEAKVFLEKGDEGFGITRVELSTRVESPGADPAAFEEATKKAKAGCPVSRVLKAEISLEATLVN